MKLTRQMTICIIGGLILLGLYQSSPAKSILLDSLGTDRTTAYSMQNKIVTCEVGGQRKTHIAYCRVEPNQKTEPWKTKSVWVATYNHQSDSIESRTLIGKIFDNHGTPCLAVDREGYLHIVYGPHHHPFIYQKSRYPNNSTVWQAKEIVSFEYGQIAENNPYWRSKTMIEKEGKSEWTYPIIKIDSENRIHVAGSLFHSTAYVRKIDGEWEQPRIIYAAHKTFSRYNVMMNLDKNDNVYILAPDLELTNDENGYAVCDMDYYLFRSEDHGTSFQNLGTAISGPLQGNGNLAVDPQGHVHFLCIERDHEKHRWQYHVYHDGNRWHQQKIILPERYIWVSSMTIDDNGTMFILSAANRTALQWRDATNEIYLFTGVPNANREYSFSEKKIVAKKPGINCWLPDIEANQTHAKLNAKDFFIIWTEEADLDGKYPHHLTTSLQTRVYLQRVTDRRE